MGWWETENGEVLGDPPLDELEKHANSGRWKTPDDIPSDVMTAIVNSYRDGLGRDPNQAELAALLALHRGDVTLGVVAGIRRVPGPAGP